MKLLVIVLTGSNDLGEHYAILDSDSGEYLAGHLCSHKGYAYGDLYGNCPERQEKWKERFGEIEVKFLEETDISEEELVKRNHSFKPT